MTDSELKTRTTNLIIALVTALADRKYEDAETIAATLAKEYGYDADAVFKQARREKA